MDERIKFFVGVDAHKDSMSIAACEAGREPARFVGTVGPDLHALLKLLAKAGDPCAGQRCVRGRTHRLRAASRVVPPRLPLPDRGALADPAPAR